MIAVKGESIKIENLTQLRSAMNIGQNGRSLDPVAAGIVDIVVGQNRDIPSVDPQYAKARAQRAIEALQLLVHIMDPVNASPGDSL